MEVNDETIVDLGKLSFSDTFEFVMKRIMETSTANPNHKVLRHVYRNLMDFENLLLKHFIGFYNDNVTDVKKVSLHQLDVVGFLGLERKDDVCKLSTVAFLWKDNKSRCCDNSQLHVIYGEDICSTQILPWQSAKIHKVDNREECTIDNYENLDIAAFLDSEVKSNIDWDKKKDVIPSIVPPLKLKPVLSNEYIDIWHESVEWIREAKKIIVVGYSFNYADEHFNDLIRKNRDKLIYVIDPFAKNIIQKLQHIYSYREEDYTKYTIQGKTAYKRDKLTIIEAHADEIDIDKVFG